MIRVLHIGFTENRGGIESFAMNLYRNIDRNKIQFDFLVYNDVIMPYEDEILELGGKVYKNSYRRKDPKRYTKNFIKFLKDQDYDFVHFHRTNIWDLDYLWMAKMAGVKKRILHSHSSGYINKSNPIKKILEKINKLNLDKLANIYLACSKNSGEWMFDSSNYKIIYNGIDYDKFNFSIKNREKIRNHLNIKDTDILIGHVGTFLEVKNHDFIIDLYINIFKENHNYKLLLVGEGGLRGKMMQKCIELNMQDNVIFTGSISNLNEFFSAMDLFILPSKFEGLPLVGIEAQANGLPVIFSNKITREVKLNDNVFYLDINDSKAWSNYIINNNLDRIDFDIEKFEKFNIKNVAKEMEKIYLNTDMENI